MLTDIINKLIDFITSPGVILLGTVTLIDIAPIKIDPWKWIIKGIGDLIFGEIRKEISELKQDMTDLKEDRKEILEMKQNVTDLKKDFEDNKAKEKRWHILDFVNSCRRGEEHSREEWSHAMSELAEYEVYCELHKITNGVIEEDAKYLRHLYYERNLKNDFL